MILFHGIIVWIGFDSDWIILIAVPTDVIKYNEVSRMDGDIHPLIKAAEHQEHVVDCPDGSVSYAL